jgi:hypothetical protein
MNTDYLDQQLKEAPSHLKDMLRRVVDRPTERNVCYAVGYLTALKNTGQIDDEMYSFFMGTVRNLEGNEFMIQTLKEKLK